MTKRQLIDEIQARNTTADAEFLARFDDEELDDYLTNLRRLQTPRLTGNAERYEKYFQFNVPSRPVRRQPDPAVSPCLPAEENDVDDSFWHLDQEFEADDEELRKRVDRFAEQLVGQMTDKGEPSDDDDYDDNSGSIVYHRTGSLLDDSLDEPYDKSDEEDGEALQNTGVRSGSHSRDNDSWLF